MRIALIFILSLVFASPIYSQEQIPYVNSGELIQKGEDLYSKGEYKKALECYAQIHECDTNYAVAVYDEINSYIADSAYKTAIQLAILGTKISSDKRSFLLLLGSAYDYDKKPDSALMIYDRLAKQYPNDHQPLYESGIVYFLQKKYDLAQYYFQRAVLINPYHFRSQYMLGRTYALQGRLTEAMMALETSLLMTQDLEQAKQPIGIISSIVEETDDVNKMYNDRNGKYSNAVYDDIDQIVNAKLALNREYKLQISIDDNIFRQTQAIMEKLKFDANDTTFSMQYYVPLLTGLYKNQLFEPYMLLLFSNFGLKNIEAQVKKNKDEIETTRNIVFPYYNQIQRTREITYSKRDKAPELYHYYPSDDFLLVGHVTGEGTKTAPKGDVVLYRTNQSLLGKGFGKDNGDKEGLWTYYYTSGQLKTEETYKDNVVVDTMREYYSNGNLRKITIMDHAGAELEEQEYSYQGSLETIRRKVNDKEYEEITYYSNGQAEVSIRYSEKAIKDGTYTFYYRNGKVKKIATSKKGKYSGVSKKYDEEGQLTEECTYEDGDPEGLCTTYYGNGKVENTYNYHKGKAEGEFKEYFDNGELAEAGSYHKGKKNGTDIRYDLNGHKYVELEEQDDVPVSIKYFDASDKVYYERADKKGLDNYSHFYPNGNKYVDMRIDDAGFRDGKITFYYSTGSKSDELNYKKGSREGCAYTYYRNGKIHTDENYKDDHLDGYYKAYFDNGTLQQEGWYKEGNRQGLWRYYTVNGKADYDIYFLNGANNGLRKIYNINGELLYKDMYDYSMLTGTVMYDAAGNVYDSTTYVRGNGHYHMPGKNGVTIFESTLKNGLLNNAYTKRYADGKVRETGYFKDGEKDSSSISYFPNGSKQAEGKYHEGSKTGKWVYYNEAGELLDEENYVNGSLEGARNLYACNTLRIRYNFKKGNKDGAQLYYGEDGRTAFVLYFEDGDLTGYAYEGKDGKVAAKVRVKNGTASFTAYYSNGQKSAEISILENSFNGPQKIYYSNGKLAEERNCVNSDLEGAFRRYNPDGKICYEVNYTSDEVNGTEKTYDKNGNLEISKEYYFGVPHGKTEVTDAATKKTKVYTYRYDDLINTAE